MTEGLQKGDRKLQGVTEEGQQGNNKVIARWQEGDSRVTEGQQEAYPHIQGKLDV